MLEYAIINLVTNKWEAQSNSFVDIDEMLMLFRRRGKMCVLVKVINDQNDYIPPVPED